MNHMLCFSSLVIVSFIVVFPTSPHPVTLVDMTYEMSRQTPTSAFHKRLESLNLRYIHPNPQLKDIRFAVQEISGSEHSGTHMDAPFHFNSKGKTMEQIPIEQFSGPAIVINIIERAEKDRNAQLTVQDLENWEQEYGKIPENAWVLLNSGWDRFWQDEKKFLGTDTRDVTQLSYPGFSGEACKWLVENRKINGVGSDTSSADPGDTETYPCHYTLTQNGVLILENVFNVGELPPEGAVLRAYPIKIKGGTGAPTRIIASFSKPPRIFRTENEL